MSMNLATSINDQPVASRFFGTGNWLTDFVTPKNPDVQRLYESLTKDLSDEQDKLMALWDWVSRLPYVRFVSGKLQIEGRTSIQRDYWMDPALTIQIRKGNCANKAFLLTSLLRNMLPADRVYCALGNLYQPEPGGHAWTVVKWPVNKYILEATNHDMRPLVEEAAVDIYEPVLYFNDESVMAIEDRAMLQPMCAVYADWLRDYLDWTYIHGEK